MKKVLVPSEMVRIESLAYKDGAQEESFMHAAGRGVASVIKNHFTPPGPILLLCSKGNNSGDAYVAGIDLLQSGYQVQALQITPIDQCGPLCQKNGKKFAERGGSIYLWEEGSKWPDEPFSLILDGLFGTGFHGVAKEPYASLIEAANHSNFPIFSIDIPSGLDGATGCVKGAAIHPSKTIYLGLPKLGFFLKNGWDHIGELMYVDFGLDEKYVAEANTNYKLLEPNKLNMPPIQSSRHKYQAGSVAALTGSPGMPGAAMLSSFAALRTGAGIVHLLHPEGMEEEFSAAPYELVRVPYSTFDVPIERINQSSAALIGPGIGKSKPTSTILEKILSEINIPSVIDADALNLIAEYKFKIPKHSILTPHRGEMARLLGMNTPKEITKNFLEQCCSFSERNQCILVLKGGPTYLFEPGEKILISPWGNPGMATAGCGDVLTGIIAALLAQGLSSQKSARLGTILHGFAGEIAAKKWTPYCLIASDLIEELPEAIKRITSP